MKRHIWKVEFESEFSSWSGNNPFTKPEPTQTEHVLTSTTDVKDAEREINLAIGPQTRITKIHSAVYLGMAINDDGPEPGPDLTPEVKKAYEERLLDGLACVNRLTCPICHRMGLMREHGGRIQCQLCFWTDTAEEHKESGQCA